MGLPSAPLRFADESPTCLTLCVKEDNSLIPTECKMEDLSGLEKLQPNMLLNLVFAGIDENIERKTTIYRKIFVRLIDKTLDEYNEAQSLILEQIIERKRSDDEMKKKGRVLYMLKFVDHMENCIGTLRRILRILDKLKGNREGLSFPRTIRRQIESLSTPLVELRNTIEHVEEAIQKDEIQENEPVMIKITGAQDGVSVGNNAITFFEISTLIKRLHGFGQDLARWRVGDNLVGQNDI